MRIALASLLPLALGAGFSCKDQHNYDVPWLVAMLWIILIVFHQVRCVQDANDGGRSAGNVGRPRLLLSRFNRSFGLQAISRQDIRGPSGTENGIPRAEPLNQCKSLCHSFVLIGNRLHSRTVLLQQGQRRRSACAVQ